MILGLSLMRFKYWSFKYDIEIIMIYHIFLYIRNIENTLGFVGNNR